MKHSKAHSCRSITRMLIMALMVLGLGFSASAQYAGPQVERFYPQGDQDAFPASSYAMQELKSTATWYVYFSAKVNSMKFRVLQNDVVLGTGEASSKAPSFNVISVRLSNYPAFDNITSGKFSIEVYGVSYTVDDEVLNYESTSEPIAWATYLRKQDASIVKESGFEDNLFVSYLPANSDKGVKTFTFSEPIIASKANVALEYGSGDIPSNVIVPFTMSDDDMTMIIDFRGNCYNVATLAPGKKFTDDFGNEVAPPSRINLSISNLTTKSGNDIITTTYDPITGASHQLKNQIHCVFDYTDITFDNPQLVEAQFFSSKNPSELFTAMNSATDKMNLIVLNSDVIEYTDILLETKNAVSVISDKDIIKEGDKFTFTIPNIIRYGNTTNIVISLINTTWNIDDGATHTVKPLDLSNLAKEVATIADAKEMVGEEVIIYTKEGIKITLADPASGYVFGEDSTGGLQFVTEDFSTVLFTQGTLIEGRIAGTIEDGGLMTLNPSLCDFTESPVNVESGIVINSIEELNESLANMLVTVNASADIQIVMEDGDECPVINGEIPVITDLASDFEAPEAFYNVTGIYYLMPGGRAIVLRSNNDVNHETFISSYTNIADAKNAAPYSNIRLDVSNAKVTFVMEYQGFILEDETGAIMVASEDGEIETEMGKALTGSILGEYWPDNGGILVYQTGNFAVDQTDCDVTFGSELSLDDLAKPENAYRLVTIRNTEATPLAVDESGFGVTVADGQAAAVDYYSVLDWDYTFPSTIECITGILLPSFDIMDLFDASSPALIALRSEDDIVAGEPTKITLVDGTEYTRDTDIDGIDVAYVRNFRNTSWQPLYIPFNMSYDEFAPYVKVAEINGVHQFDNDDDGIFDETILEFKLVTSGELRPHTPYVVKAYQTGEITFECTDKTLSAAPEENGTIWCASSRQKYTLTGTYTPVSNLYEAGVYVMSGGNFYTIGQNDNRTLNPYRTYLTIENCDNGYGVAPTPLPKQVKVMIEGEISGIEDILLNNNNADYYDLMGRKVTNPAPGIYIHNGKKHLIK